ncbi:MAG: hypothetical protein IKA74_05895 [Clostridia bacterium]|nr:hypothetical protein [Clostridia bacterium]
MSIVFREAPEGNKEKSSEACREMILTMLSEPSGNLNCNAILFKSIPERPSSRRSRAYH